MTSFYCDPGIKNQQCGNVILTSNSGTSSRQLGGCFTRDQCANFCNGGSMAGSLICKMTCCNSTELCNKPRACATNLTDDVKFNNSCIQNVDYGSVYRA